MSSRTSYNVKIYSGAKTPFEVEVYYTSVNNVQQIINGTVQTVNEIAIRIQNAIEKEFNQKLTLEHPEIGNNMKNEMRIIENFLKYVETLDADGMACIFEYVKSRIVRKLKEKETHISAKLAAVQQLIEEYKKEFRNKSETEA